MMPSMAENWANTPAKVAVPPTPPARRQSSYVQGQGQVQGKSARNHLEGIYADIANKVADCSIVCPTDHTNMLLLLLLPLIHLYQYHLNANRSLANYH
jgi:hypothetical protein